MADSLHTATFLTTGYLRLTRKKRLQYAQFSSNMYITSSGANGVARYLADHGINDATTKWKKSVIRGVANSPNN